MSCVCVCLCVLWQKPNILVDWRLLVEDHITNIGKPLDVLRCCFFNDFLAFEFCLELWVFAIQPKFVHNGGVSRGRVCGCGCWR